LSKVRQSLWLSLFSTNTATVLNFLSSLAIARLLTPAEIGIYSVASVLVGLAHLFRDFGVGSYIVSERELTPERVRAAFGFTIMTAWGLALVLALSSGFVAAFYRTPGMETVMLVLALNFVVSPFGAITLSNLGREMRFGARAVVDLTSTVAHIATAIGLALIGFGYMSLAWASVIGTITAVLVVQRYRPSDWPWYPSIKGIRRIIGFGSGVTAAAVLGHVNASLTEIILGRGLGMESVALFGRAQGALQAFQGFLVGSIRGVSYSYFAERFRSGHDPKEPYLSTITLSTGVAWPFFFVLAVVASPAIELLYGSQWVESGRLLPTLCIAATLSVPFLLASSLYNAIGRSGVPAFIEGFGLSIKLVAILVAMQWGLMAVAVSFACVSAAMGIVHLSAQTRLLGLTAREVGRALIPSLLVASPALAAAYAGSLAVPVHTGGPALLIDLLVPGVFGFIAWTLAVYLFRHPLRGEIARALRAVWKFATRQ
jgi:O-antigen/teichoic acid export membrane protein